MKKKELPLDVATLMNRFVEYVAPFPDGRHRVAQVVEIDKVKQTDEGALPALKVRFRVGKKRKIKKKDGTSYIKTYRETEIVALERIRMVYLKVDSQGRRRGIPFDEWCLRHPYHKL